jgi:hypothetical protein
MSSEGHEAEAGEGFSVSFVVFDEPSEAGYGTIR